MTVERGIPAASDDLLLVGHPFAPIGRGEDVRTCFRALRNGGGRPRLLDVFDSRRRHFDPELEEELAGSLVTRGAADVRIFFLNGDEVENAWRALGADRIASSLDIVYPVWELSRYPERWASLLDQFDEIWVPSRFVADAVRPEVKKPVAVLPWPIQPVLGPLRGRRDFGIPESAFAFLFLFDLRSYSSRKNPEAVVEAFRRLVEARPASNAVLVLKVAGAETNPKEMARLRDLLNRLGSRVVLLTREATDSETKNLIRSCDVFVSLHRSEGFGRGLAEAMAFGRPVVGTGYSGNLEFMAPQNSCLVGYDLVPVAKDAYPFWTGQVWADAHVDEAADWMVRLLDDEELARTIGAAGRRTVACELSYAACGLRMRDRLATIAGTRSPGAANVG